jgi:hypothetical protein
MPYAVTTLRSKKSLSNGKVAPTLVANSFWEGVLSVLMPKTLVSLPSNFAIPAWYAVISRVQPPVKAAGKNASTTVFFPRKLERVTFPPWVEVKVKSGAMSPSFSLVCGGWMFWANRFTASRPAPNTNAFVMVTILPRRHRESSGRTPDYDPGRLGLSAGRQVGIGAPRLSGTLPTSLLRSAKVSRVICSQSSFDSGSACGAGIWTTLGARLFIPYRYTLPCEQSRCAKVCGASGSANCWCRLVE